MEPTTLHQHLLLAYLHHGIGEALSREETLALRLYQDMSEKDREQTDAGSIGARPETIPGLPGPVQKGGLDQMTEHDDKLSSCARPRQDSELEELCRQLQQSRDELKRLKGLLAAPQVCWAPMFPTSRNRKARSRTGAR
jgi:hypothetical protein